MKTVIKLSDFSREDVLRDLPERHKNSRMIASRVYDKLVKSGLKYNTKSGFTTDSSGHLSNFPNSKDVPVYDDDDDDVLHDAFMPWVCNGISRVLNGYDVL